MTDVFQVQAWYRHISATVSEGLCPEHHTPLQPAKALDGRIAGTCSRHDVICWFWYNPVTAEAGWSRGIWNPVTGQYLYPEWLA